MTYYRGGTDIRTAGPCFLLDPERQQQAFASDQIHLLQDNASAGARTTAAGLCFWSDTPAAG